MPVQRNIFKRIFASLLWLIPFMVALNLVLYFFLGFTLKETERAWFYEHLGIVVQICNLIWWFSFCRAGYLPGTGSGMPEAKRAARDKKFKKIEEALKDTTYEDEAQGIIKRDLEGY